MCEIAINVDDFTGRALVSLLRTGNTLGKIAEAIDNLPTRIARELTPQRDDVFFLRRYRDTVVRRLDWLDLPGVRLESIKQRYKLTAAYVTLNVRPPAQDGDLSAPHDVSVDTLLKSRQRVLLIGEPGAGKTTILKWVAVNCVRSSFPPDLDDWNGRIPFMVKLRSLSSGRLPLVEELANHILPADPSIVSADWCEGALRFGRGVLLVDGLDEVDDVARQNVYDWIDTLAEAFPRAYILVTSRPAALRETPFTSSRFFGAYVVPMSLPQLTGFVGYWHESVLSNDSLPDGESASEVAEELRARL